MKYAFPPPAPAAVPVAGSDDHYPVRRIFCVGRNYVAHAQEMGGEVDREAPWYFTKSTTALALPTPDLAFPRGTDNYHHEVELVVALGKAARDIRVDQAEETIFGFACGLDMTRRDLQQVAKDHRRPWDLGKDVEGGAIIAPILQTRALPGRARIQLSVNGARRQDAVLSDMVWTVPEVIAHLSGYYDLGPGDLIMTGTPAGVGPVVPGDRIDAEIDGLPKLSAGYTS